MFTSKSVFTILIFTLSIVSLKATTDKYRAIFRSDPSTSISIGWNQVSGNNPVMYFDTLDHGMDWQAYAFNAPPAKIVDAKGMNNHFIRLLGLSPNTAYYFVIHDDESTSERFWFKTVPGTPDSRLSLIAGGDSRNNRIPRQHANMLVSKLRVHAVLFGGDMTDDDTNSQWQDWFDDWQLTIAPDGRMTPIVATRGNHEDGNQVVEDLFDVPHPAVYYALTFGGSLLRAYTLNSMNAILGNQTDWLEADLIANDQVIWKMAQYHRPMIPHTASKPDNLLKISAWAPLFDAYDVNLVVECDAHMVKSTYPIRQALAGETGDEFGFLRDDDDGTVYVGEGSWGAPLRPNDDNHAWTRSSGTFNQFKWIFVDQQQIKVRTVMVDNADSVAAVDDSNIFLPPANLQIWDPPEGAVICIDNPAFSGAPTVSLTAPLDGQLIVAVPQIQLKAIADDADGSIELVNFYADNIYLGSDDTPPYNFTWMNPAPGAYEIIAEAVDNDGFSSTSKADIMYVLPFGNAFSVRVENPSDDAEEGNMGIVDLTSSDLEMVYDNIITGNQTVGIRFNDIEIPFGAVFTNAFIQFTSDEGDSDITDLDIWVENTPQPATFSTDIDGRQTTGTSINWIPVEWTAANLAGPDQQTPSLIPLLNDAIGHSEWRPGNSVVFIIDGSGQRSAISYDADPAKAAELVYQYNWNMPPPDLPAFPQPLAFCEGESLLLDGGSEFIAYFWNGDPSPGQGQIYEVSSAGLLQVQFMDLYGQVVSAFLDIQEWEVPVIDDLHPVPVMTGFDGSVDLTVSGGTEPYTFEWSNGSMTEDIQGLEGGFYQVTVTDTNGCTITGEVEVAVTVSTNQIEGLESLHLSPNPGKGIFNIAMKLTVSADIVLEVIDASGQLIASEDYGSGTSFSKVVDIRYQPPGIYFFVFTVGESRIPVKVLIVD